MDPLVCPECGAEMEVIAIIEDPDELKRILRHLAKIGRSPPGFDSDRLNSLPTLPRSHVFVSRDKYFRISADLS